MDFPVILIHSHLAGKKGLRVVLPTTQATIEQCTMDFLNYRIFLKWNKLCHKSSEIQNEHKFLPWLQTFITRKLPGNVGTAYCTSEEFQPWIIFQQDGAPPHWGFGCSSVFGCNISKQADWERWSDTLATTITGYRPPFISFYVGTLRTKCFRHQFQILQIWRQE